MESQGTLCQCSCFSPHSPGSHGARLLDLFVSLSHKAWNELKCSLISSAKSPGGTEATDHECAEGKAVSGPEQPHSLGRLLQEWPMGPGAEQSQGDSDLLDTPAWPGKGGASLLERWWGRGPRLSPDCPLGGRLSLPQTRCCSCARERAQAWRLESTGGRPPWGRHLGLAGREGDQRFQGTPCH